MSWLNTDPNRKVSKMRKPGPVGYRVDLWLIEPQCYTEYTALKTPVEREMAEALGRGLQRQNQRYRIVDVSTGNVIIEFIPETRTLDDLRSAIAAGRITHTRMRPWCGQRIVHVYERNPNSPTGVTLWWSWPESMPGLDAILKGMYAPIEKR